jgi:hypothetical protein
MAKNLGIRCEVSVGDSTSIKDKAHGFKIPGNFVLRPNENRFDGGSIMYGQYGEEQSYIARDLELRKLTREAVSRIGTMEERHKAYHDVYVAAREAHYEWSLATLNTPWGAGPKIKSWQPAPLLPYASNLWTIELAR